MSSDKWWEDFDTGSDVEVIEENDLLTHSSPKAEPEEEQVSPSYQSLHPDKGVDDFLLAFKSLAPLLSTILNKDGDMSAELPSLYAQFSSCYSDAVTYLQSQFGNIPDGTLSILEQQIAEAFGAINEPAHKQAKEHLLSIIRFSVESGHLGNIRDRSILDDDESIDKLSVKLKLLPVLAELGFWVDSVQLCWFGVHLKEIQGSNIDLSVSMAKDLAFHWTKDADIASREQVFATILPYCGNALVDTYSCWLLEQLPPLSSNSLNTPEDIYLHYPELCEVLRRHSMGYESTVKQAQLKVEVADLIWSMLPAKLQVTDEVTQRLRLLALQKIVARFTEVWIDASEQLIAKLSNLSSEEFDEWRKSDEAKTLIRPSSLEIELRSHLYEKVLKVDKAFLSKEAKARLTAYWAATDAVFAVTNEILEARQQ